MCGKWWGASRRIKLVALPPKSVVPLGITLQHGMSASGTQGCNSVDGNSAKYGLAIAASVFSSAGSAAGMIMQKWAHNEQQALPVDEKYSEAEGIICSPSWWVGAVVLILVPVSAPPDRAASHGLSHPLTIAEPGHGRVGRSQPL